MSKPRVITMREQLGIPDPRPPIKKVVLDTWTKDIRCRFSTELEQRLLVFYPETRALYDEWHERVAELANPQCYWEGFSPDCNYGEFNFENDMPKILHYMVEFEDIKTFANLYNQFEAHYPQKHRPNMQMKYIPDSEFIKEAKKFPMPYKATGFAKEFRTRYDMEMEAVYNIHPGFSTPIPDSKAIYNKLRRLMRMHSKQFGVDLIRKFGFTSALDLWENRVAIEYLYHLDAACSWELNAYEEAHP